VFSDHFYRQNTVTVIETSVQPPPDLATGYALDVWILWSLSGSHRDWGRLPDKRADNFTMKFGGQMHVDYEQECIDPWALLPLSSKRTTKPAKYLNLGRILELNRTQYLSKNKTGF
jgi:hypothetical protein